MPMIRIAWQVAEDIWNGLVAGLRAIAGEPLTPQVLAYGAILVWALASH